jgi:hypothetical protein
MSNRAYPLRRLDDDPRFTYGLVFDIGRTLERHGFPPVQHGDDLVALMTALFGFIYEQKWTPHI